MLSVEVDRMPGNAGLRGHGHAAPHLLIVFDGDLSENAAKAPRQLRAGSVRVSRAGAHHDLWFGAEGATCFVAEARGPFWSRIFARALGQGETSAFGASGDAAAILARQPTHAALIGSRAAMLALGGALAACAGRERAPPPWLEDVLHALDHGAPLHRVARALARDRTHVTRSFGAALGFRPAEYRALRRLGRALDLLREPDAPLAEVAFACGYAHQSHMGNAFRAVLGCTPAQWRVA